MEHWTSWPWIEMLIACTFLIGTGLSLFLLLNKFPASRYLGQLIVAYLVFIVCSGNEHTLLWSYLALVFVGLSLNWYAFAFFTQNSRIKARHVWFCLFVLLIVGLGYYTGQLWLIKSVSVGAILGLLVESLQDIKKETSNRGIFWFQNPGPRLVWFRNYLGLNVFLLVPFLFFGHLLNLATMTIGTLINFVYIYYQVFRESGFASPIPVANKYKKSTLSASQKTTILEKLDRLISEDKFYLRDDASLGNLAEQLHATTHHLSQVLNESKGISFQELISQNRIREARHLLKDPSLQQTKVENIAALVGYNSKSAFNTAFKRHSGMTPSEYRAAKDVRPYREERLPDRKKPYLATSTFSLSHLFTLKLKHNMVANFFKTFIRALNRNKVFTLINLFGLTVGFTCSILIYLYILDELSFDRSLPNYDNIYRISWIADPPQTRTPHPMAQAMRRDFPEVINAVSFSPWYGTGLTKQEISVKNTESNILFEEPDFYFADSTFFDVFELEIIAGDKNALNEPNTLIITEELAKKYFGEENAVGKILEVSDMPIEVSAVVQGMPKNAHFHFNALISYMTVKQIDPESHWMTWADFGHFNYIVLNDKVSYKDVEAKIGDWVFDYLDWGEDAKVAFENGTIAFELQPMKNIHLHSHLRWELESNGNILYIYILSGTMVFILIISSINYINLTTAKSVERAKEIGIRKTLGAVSTNLTVQFYLETILFCFAAMLMAMGLTALTVSPFNDLSSKSFEVAHLFNYAFIGKALLLCLIIGLIAGLYPALFLSSFAPSDVLKGKLSANGSSSRLRSLLVVCQFIVSAILITSSLIILKQIDYMKSKELGFEQDAVISIPIPSSVEHGGIDVSKTRAIQNELRAIPGIKQVSSASNLPGSQFNNHPVTAKKDPANRVGFSEIFVDFELIELLDFELLKGRTFNRSYAADSAGTNVLINQMAAKALNLSDPIGEHLTWYLDGYELEITIVGMVKDFHYKSLHQPINPLIIQYQPQDFNFVVVKLEGKGFQESIEAMKNVYSNFGQDQAFEFHFLDEQLADLYQSEVQTLSVFSIFALIALFLACLGLLGIALAMLSQKVKEVGVRKILGASSLQIVQMIFLQFTRLIGIALVLGLPLAYVIMQEWLNEFPYQVTLGMVPFVWSALLLLLVAISSVSLVVSKIAATDPVRALRYE